MHRRVISACLVLTAVFLGGCSAGSIGDEPSATQTPPSDEPFAPAAAPIPSEQGTIDPRDPSVPPTFEGEDGDDPVEGEDPPPPPAGTCADPSSLKQLVACVTARMPRSDSNLYVEPNAVVTTAWRAVVRAMMTGACETITVPAALTGVSVATFRDSENGRSYCVLRETLDADGDGFVDRGLGTFIVDPAAERELVHSAPHPFTDDGTEEQAVVLFRDTHSRAFLFTGAHRRANSKLSACQSAYHVSDAAHESNHLFHATTAELAAFYATLPSSDWTEFQWHGMSATTCPGVNAFMTYGVSASPAAGSKLAQLRDAMRAEHPDWAVHMPGTAACSMGGTNNVQGRMLNAVAVEKVCGTATSVASGRFIHIEQQPGHRSAKDWLAAIAKVFPAK